MDINKLFPIPKLDFSALCQPRAVDLDYFQFYGLDLEQEISGVSHYFGTFEAKGFDIACHYYVPDKPVGTMFLVHGYFDHVGLYKHAIRFALEKRLAVVGMDLPGHGLSSGAKASIGDFSLYIDVFQTCLATFTGHCPAPWSVLAQSTGGAITMDYLINHENPFNKIILLAPLVKPVSWWLVRIYLGVSRAFNLTKAREFVENSHDENFLQFVAQQDPLQSRQHSVQWLMSLQTWIPRFLKYNSCETELLLIQGSGDQTVDWRYNIPSIQSKFPNSQYFELDEARHHLINESENYRESIFKRIADYLES